MLIVFALVLLIAEAHVSAYGVLAISGLAALVTGLLIVDDQNGWDVSPVLIIAVAICFAALILLAARKVLQARRKQVKTGWEELAGETAEVRVALDPTGQVFTHGALWQARSASGITVGVGATVVVDSVDGLTLVVIEKPDRDQNE